jgi:hypothetical protein
MPLGKERMRKAFESATHPTLDKALDSFGYALGGLTLAIFALTVVLVIKLVTHGI